MGKGEHKGLQEHVIQLRIGDSIEVLRDFDPNSIGAVVTDPPYGLEFMGKDWDAPWKYGFSEHGFTDGGDRRPGPGFTSSRNPTCKVCGLRQRTWEGGPGKCECDEPAFDSHVMDDRQKFQAWCALWLRECYRVLKPGGKIKVFGATRMFHRMATAMEDAGFLLDPESSLEALGYGSGFPKYLDTSKAIDKQAGAERGVIGRRDDGRYKYGFSPEARRAQGGVVHDFSAGWVGDPSEITAPVTDDAKRFEGYATALKPGWEPFVVGIKPV